jgi:hypothetical protein
MDENEKLKITSFADPLIQLALGAAFVGDILFILIPIRYILAVIVFFIIWSGTKGLITKIIFILCLVLPLPFMTVGAVLGVLLSNSFIRGVVVSVAVGVLTGGVGTLAEAGALALETAGKQAAVKVAGKVGGEKAEKLAGAASSLLGKGKGAEAESKVAGTAAVPKELPSPVAQPSSELSGSAQKSRFAGTREKFRTHATEHEEELKEKLYRDPGDTGGQSGDVIKGEFGPEAPESNPEDERVDLRRDGEDLKEAA